jgi:hypothetical protein
MNIWIILTAFLVLFSGCPLDVKGPVETPEKTETVTLSINIQIANPVQGRTVLPQVDLADCTGYTLFGDPGTGERKLATFTPSGINIPHR